MLIPLERIDPEAIHRVGGKAAALAALHRHHVAVLPGFVIPTEVHRRFLEANGLLERALAGGDDDLERDILDACLEPALTEALHTAVVHLGPRVAVRSSGVVEDGAEASYAGQYETVLSVTPGEDTQRAVLRCWSSQWTPRSRAYGAHFLHAGAPMPMMAVLIQPMIEPRSAGVMFTVNPLTGSWREMTIEAAWGHGEAVVGGHVVPDYYVVRRPRRAPRPVQRVLARVRLEVVADHVRSQRLGWQPGPDGGMTVPIPRSRVEAPKLRHAELFKLCRLGLRIEGLLGGPQDIEWAQDESGHFVVLQSRPVTSAAGVRRSGPTLWTRRFVGERWTEPATPLGWSLMRGMLEDFIGYPVTSEELLDGGAPTQLVRFTPYFNVTVFRHLSFKLPGMPPPRFMMELLPPDEERGWLRRRAQAPDFRAYASVLRETYADKRWQRFRWNPLTNHRAWDRFETTLGEELDALGADIHTLSDANRVRAQCGALAQSYIGIHVCSLLFANLLYQMCEGWLLARGQASLASDALRPDAESWTVRTNHALWRLGRGEMDETAFLAAYGHRAASSWELFSPRWAEAPQTVRILAEAAAQHGDPAALARQQVQRAIDARGDLGWGLRKTVALTQRYLLLRENQRFHFDRLLWTWKRAFLWIESHLDMAIRFLESTELDALMSGALSADDARDRIARRSAAWDEEIERRAQGDEPPVFLVGNDAVEPLAADQRLQGMGISRGVATGTVRVLHSIEEADRLQKGDILVARATDPGWTPLFLKAGGLVMELGGMLSHGAVVAREYGLPAVVNVTGATQRLKDGQRITVDGARGMVWVR
jgi:phosphohistidine swiveling domain-containing protein